MLRANNNFHRRFVLGFLLLVFVSGTSFAHPMGNFSVNHYSKITIGSRAIEIFYLVDMAEISTDQEIREFEITARPDDPSVGRYLDRQEPILRAGLSVEIDGRPVSLGTIERRVTFNEGAGGLLTMKIGLVFRGQLDFVAGAHRISFADNNFAGRAGWKEIVVLGEGAEMVNMSAPANDRSRELTTYSSDALNSPPQQLSAEVSYRTAAAAAGSASASATETSTERMHLRASPPGKIASGHVSSGQGVRDSLSEVASVNRDEVGPSASRVIVPVVAAHSRATRAQNTPRSRFTDLISTQGTLSFWFLFTAALIAAGLGALHALEPGHGKTIVAAYLVGSRGTAKHAVLLGIVVTAAHTAGVFLLGAVTLYASRYIVPEQLYPWLGAISGLSVAGLGIFIFLRHWTVESGEHCML